MSECGRPNCYITDLHSHQAGTDGVIGQVCEHGSLARSCYICELELENKELKESMACQGEEKDPAKHGCCNCFYVRYGELNSENKRLSEEHKQCHEWNMKLVVERTKFKKTLEKIANTFGYSDDTFDEYRKLAKEALRGGGE